MGSYLDKQEPAGQGMVSTRDLKDCLTRPNPAVPTPARRLSFRDTPMLTDQALLSPRRRYPIKQPQFSRPGSLPTGCFDAYQKKIFLSPKRSRATMKFPRLDTSFARSPILDNFLLPRPASPTVACAPDPCAKETILKAIKECMKRKQMSKEYSANGGLENKRRRLESNGSAESSDYLLPNGTLPSYFSEQASSGSAESSSEHLSPNVISPSYVSQHDSLKRGLHSQVLEDPVNKRSRTTSVSSRSNTAINGIKKPTHDAITSSYSSSSIKKRKRGLQCVSATSSSPSSRSQMSDLFTKKARESHEAGHSPLLQSESDLTGRLSESLSPSSSATSSPAGRGRPFPRREKLMLLIAQREPYKLPPPPIPGYSVTQKDYDADKRASFQRLHEAIGVGAKQTVNTSTPDENIPVSRALEKIPVSAFLASSEPANPSGSTPTASFLPKASSLPAPVPAEESNSTPPQSSDTTVPKPPKSSLLQILTKPLENDSQSAFTPVLLTVPPASTSTVVTTAAPVINFKPMFGENPPLQSSNTFKPIFGDPAAQPAATSSFTFQMNPTTSTATPLFTGFGVKSTGTAISTDTATKPSLAPVTSSTTSTLPAMFSESSTAPVNSLLVSKAPADSPANPFVFKPTTTSQATSGLNVFSTTQPVPAPVSAPQQSSLFAFKNSAFTAPVSSNPPAPLANSRTPTSGSAKTLPTFGGFGTSSLPIFGTNSQPQFGVNSTFNAITGNSTFVSKEPFGNLNSAQTNSSPATNLFASKPVAPVESSNSAPFGALNATSTQSLGFGNSLAQNSVLPNPSTPFGTQGTADNALSFAAPFGQSSPATPLSFTTSTPSSTASPFGNFKIGTTPKPVGPRQRVSTRRQHQRKK